MARRPPIRSHLLKVLPPPNSAKLGTRLLTYEPLGELPGPNNSTNLFKRSGILLREKTSKEKS
jgi:hypothetical protein